MPAHAPARISPSLQGMCVCARAEPMIITHTHTYTHTHLSLKTCRTLLLQQLNKHLFFLNPIIALVAKRLEQLLGLGLRA